MTQTSGVTGATRRPSTSAPGKARTDLRAADLRCANLTRANLSRANLERAELTAARFTAAAFDGTVFGAANLIDAVGLESVEHRHPSTIGANEVLRTLLLLPSSFLRGCGYSETLIQHVPTLGAAATRGVRCLITCHRDDRQLALLAVAHDADRSIEVDEEIIEVQRDP